MKAEYDNVNKPKHYMLPRVRRKSMAYEGLGERKAVRDADMADHTWGGE